MKKYKTVVFDIDNTLTLLEPLLETIAFYFKCTPIKAHEAQHFSLAKTYGLTKEQEDYFWNENEWFMHAGAQLARERVDKIFSEYLEEDATIYILTARGPEHSNITRKWLNFNNMPYNEVFCIGKNPKSPYLRNCKPKPFSKIIPTSSSNYGTKDFFRPSTAFASIIHIISMSHASSVCTAILPN